MQKIFLDVGGHYGETLREVLGAEWKFDLVHCFEPQAHCYAKIKQDFAAEIESGKLVLHNFGLADFAGEKILFGGQSSDSGASLFADKNDINSDEQETCKFITATEFINANIADDDFAVMKLNCEGAEILILRDLMASGEIHKLKSVFIDFDIRKIPSKASEQAKLISELKDANFSNYVLHTCAEVATFSFSRRQFYSRRMHFQTEPKRMWCWLTFLPKAKSIRNMKFTDYIFRAIPKFIWGRCLRARKAIIEFNNRRSKEK